MSAVEITIVRVTKSPYSPQRGVLLYQGEPIAVTLELPWLDNRHDVSCIPEGTYNGQRFYNKQTFNGEVRPIVFEVQNVPNRAGILIHEGNTVKDTHGCILIGRDYTEMDKQPAIGDSRIGFSYFCYALGVFESFTLKVCHI